jgi:hypothetical protein
VKHPLGRQHKAERVNTTVTIRSPGTTRSRHYFISEEIYFAVSKIQGFTVLHDWLECERPQVFCKHGTRKINAFGMRD